MTDRIALLIVFAVLVSQSFWMWFGDTPLHRPSAKWGWIEEVTATDELIEHRHALMANPAWIEAHPCTAAGLYSIERWRHFPRNNLAHPGGVSD